MTVARQLDLQTAVYVRLTDALLTAGPEGAAVPVWDHARRSPPMLYVRIDGGSVDEIGGKGYDVGVHRFFVHVFHRPDGSATHSVGQEDTKKIQTLIYTALNNWRPLPGLEPINHQYSSVDMDEDGETRHGLSRFSITLGVE